MTTEECVARIKSLASEVGMTVAQWVDRFNRITPEQVAKAMESMPTDVLEFGVRFEALSHVEAPRG